MTDAKDALGKAVTNQPLVVVGKDQSVEILERSHKPAEEMLFYFRSDGTRSLVVDADNLLVSTDDASLQRGNAFEVGQNTRVIHARVTQAGSQRRASLIIRHFLLSSLLPAQDPEKLNFCTESGDVRRNVSSAPETVALGLKINHGNRHLRRKAVRVAP